VRVDQQKVGFGVAPKFLEPPVIDVGELLRARETTPRFTFRGRVLDEQWLVIALRGAVAGSFDDGSRMQRRKCFCRGEMHSRPMEVGKATDVVRIEMSEDDVSHVARVETESPNMVDSGFPGVEDRAHIKPPRTNPATRVGDVAETVAGIDER
jgi:hypothetical protein